MNTFRLAAVALALGCTAPDAAPQPDAPDSGGIGLTCEDVAERGLTFSGTSRQQITAELGLPDRASSTAGAVGADSVHVMEYPGLRISLHGSAGSDIADEVRVTDNRHLRFPAAGIGASADSIRALFGEPNAVEGDRMTYVCHGESPRDDPLTFVLADGRVREVVYTWYMD